MPTTAFVSEQEGTPERRITARIAELYWPLDQAHKAYLDRMIRESIRCRFCGGHLSDANQARRAGVCSHPSCRRRDEREKRARLARETT